MISDHEATGRVILRAIKNKLKSKISWSLPFYILPPPPNPVGYVLEVEKLGCGLVVSAKAGLARLAPQWSALLRAKFGCFSHPPRSTDRGGRRAWGGGEGGSKSGKYIRKGKGQGPGLGGKGWGGGGKIPTMCTRHRARDLPVPPARKALHYPHIIREKIGTQSDGLTAPSYGVCLQ